MTKTKRKMKRQVKYFVIAVLALMILTMLVIYVKQENGLKLVGEKNIVVNLEEEYVEEGVLYKGKEVTEKVKMEGRVDYKKLGTYTITYTYQTPKGKKIKTKRIIEVKDLTLPTIELKEGEEIIILKDSTFIDPGYTATDNIDGDLTKKVKVTGKVDTSKEKEYIITYEVKDQAGNQAIKKRKVIVSSKSPLTMTKEEFTLDGMFQDTILKEKEASEEYMNKIIYAGDSIVLYYDINKLVPSKRLWYRNSLDPKTALTSTMFHLYKDTNQTMVELYKENQPELSILTLGTNSVAYMEVEVFIENYKKLIQEIQKASPKTKLIVQSIPPVDAKKDESNSPINNDKINKFNYHIVKMCQELKVKFLNSAPAMKGKDGAAKEGYCIDYDGIHPSKEGHSALYEYTKKHAYE